MDPDSYCSGSHFIPFFQQIDHTPLFAFYFAANNQERAIPLVSSVDESVKNNCVGFG